jgi:hypothetical protein
VDQILEFQNLSDAFELQVWRLGGPGERGGKELFYQAPGRGMMSLEVTTNPVFHSNAPHRCPKDRRRCASGMSPRPARDSSCPCRITSSLIVAAVEGPQPGKFFSGPWKSFLKRHKDPSQCS